MQDMQQIRVSWQAGAILLSLMFTPAAVAFSTLFSEYGDRNLRMLLWSLVALSLLLSALAVRSRLSKPGAHRRREILKELGYGFVVLAGATVLFFLSYNYAAFTILGTTKFLVPSGLYVYGFFLICNSMLPENDFGHSKQKSRLARVLTRIAVYVGIALAIFIAFALIFYFSTMR